MHRHITTGMLVLMLTFGMTGIASADSDRNEKEKWRGSASSTAIGALELQIKALKDQLKLLKKERATTSTSTAPRHDDDDDDRDEHKNERAQEKKELKQEIKQLKKELKFIRKLSRGMSCDDVRDLQELLALDPNIFPEGSITGFFGPATERALKRFQKKHGLEQVGILGPLSQARLLALFAGKELPPGIAARFGFASTTASTTPGFGLVTVCHMPPEPLSLPW